MKKSKKVTFIVKVKDYSNHTFILKWKKEYGIPSFKILKNFVLDFNQSIKEKHNKHLGEDGLICNADIIHQESGSIVAGYKAPLFAII